MAASNLKLLQIASDNITVMKAFPKDDQAKGLNDINLGADCPPMQRSLRISLNINTDEFTLQVSIQYNSKILY